MKSVKAPELRKCVRSPSLTTLSQVIQGLWPEQTNFFQLGRQFPQCLSTAPLPSVSLNWGPDTCYRPPNRTQDHQQIREMQEPGETHSKFIWTLWEGGWAQEVSIGTNLWFFIMFRRRQEVRSGSLLIAKVVNKNNKKAQCESCELSFTWDKMRTIAQGSASQISLRNCSDK